jgi:signal transduction histidine kinase
MTGATAVDVLLVEDNPGDADLIMDLLAEGGEESTLFRHVRLASEAVDALNDASFDVILLDLSLPDQVGVATVQAIRRFAGDTPIIVLTGADDEQLALRCIEFGAQDYLCKDEVERRVLRRSMSYAISRHRLAIELRRAQRMETVGQLAAGLAHEFNNLLAVMTGYTSLVLSELPAGSLAEDLRKVMQAGADAQGLTRQLLALSRRSPIELTDVDVREVLSAVAEFGRGAAHERVEVSVSVVEPLPPVRADAALLRQAVLNLVVNARDATPAGGSIDVHAAAADIQPGWRGPEGQQLVAGRYAVITVADNGRGMDEQTRRRIFEPFFTTKPPAEGTGLGLAVTLSSITQMSGQIVVESAPGMGTSVRLYLPAAPEISRRERPAEPEERRGDATVLLVEDDEAVRRLGRRILESAGYTVLEARSAEDALVVAADDGDRVDLVLTDVMMPGMNGFELVDRLHVDRPTLPALYMSGYAGDALDRQGVTAAGRRVLEKPFSRNTLLAALRRVLTGDEH